MNEKQKWAIYRQQLKAWHAKEPKSGNNYEMESWLEMKPTKPSELPS